MNKKHLQLTTPQAIQQDLEAEVGFPYLEGWPTAINTADSSIWY